MEENITTLAREIGKIPPRQEITSYLHKRYEKLFGKLTPVPLNDEIINKMIELAQWFSSPEFIFKKTPRIPKGVKIKEGIPFVPSFLIAYIISLMLGNLLFLLI